MATRTFTRITARVGQVAKLLGQLFQELSDQNAYTRHLAAHGRTHSAAEWRRFSDARLKAKYERAKCC